MASKGAIIGGTSLAILTTTAVGVTAIVANSKTTSKEVAERSGFKLLSKSSDDESKWDRLVKLNEGKYGESLNKDDLKNYCEQNKDSIYDESKLKEVLDKCAEEMTFEKKLNKGGEDKSISFGKEGWKKFNSRKNTFSSIFKSSDQETIDLMLYCYTTKKLTTHKFENMEQLENEWKNYQSICAKDDDSKESFITK